MLDPNWTLPEAMKYDALDVPWTSKTVEGVVVRIPILLLAASTDKVLVSRDKPLTPPDNTKSVSLVNVHVAALAVTVSAEVSPMMREPDILAVPPTSSVVLVSPPALIPKRLLPVTSKLVETETPPEKVAKPSVVIAPIPVKSPVAEISQSDVLIEPTSPLSPKIKIPFRLVCPATLKSRPVVMESVA